jgi:hypothetical protein
LVEFFGEGLDGNVDDLGVELDDLTELPAADGDALESRVL